MIINAPVIYELIKEHYAPAWFWDKKRLMRWVDWALGEGFVLLVMQDESTLAGLMIARPVLDAYDGFNTCQFDQEGSVIFIDLAISFHKDALKGFGVVVLSRFGMRKAIAWKRGDVLYAYPATTIRRNLFRTKASQPKETHGRLI